MGTIGPTLTRRGTQEQKDCYLPRIVAGELELALEYSEPNAGSDLAGLETRADAGGEYVIDETKAWTSAAHSRQDHPIPS